jgi:hypothetical protein
MKRILRFHDYIVYTLLRAKIAFPWEIPIAKAVAFMMIFWVLESFILLRIGQILFLHYFHKYANIDPTALAIFAIFSLVGGIIRYIRKDRYKEILNRLKIKQEPGWFDLFRIVIIFSVLLIVLLFLNKMRNDML